MCLVHRSTKFVIPLGKKYFGLRAQPRIYCIFRFLLFRKMNLPIRIFKGPNICKSLGAKCILYGECSSSSNFKSRMVLSVLLAVCGRSLSCYRITIGHNGPLASARQLKGRSSLHCSLFHLSLGCVQV